MSIDILWGETTLENVYAAFTYPMHLPLVLAEPSRVFLPTLREPMMILVWEDPFYEDKADLALFIIALGNTGLKSRPEPLSLAETVRIAESLQ